MSLDNKFQSMLPMYEIFDILLKKSHVLQNSSFLIRVIFQSVSCFRNRFK